MPAIALSDHRGRQKSKSIEHAPNAVAKAWTGHIAVL